MSYLAQEWIRSFDLEIVVNDQFEHVSALWQYFSELQGPTLHTCIMASGQLLEDNKGVRYEEGG